MEKPDHISTNKEVHRIMLFLNVCMSKKTFVIDKQDAHGLTATLYMYYYDLCSL